MDDGEKMVGLSQSRQVQVDTPHHRNQQQAYHDVDQDAGPQYLSYLVRPSVGEQGADKRCQAVREAQRGENREVEEVVDKRGGGQRVGAVMAYHYIVGESDHDHPYLGDKHGKAKPEYFCTIVQV